MFEISWSELLILAMVVLIFVGPKDMPVFFNTLGRYMGMLRRHANEFRRHFDDAMREAKMESLREELDGIRDEFSRSARDAEQAFDETVKQAGADLKTAAETPAVAPPPPADPALPAPDPSPASRTGA